MKSIVRSRSNQERWKKSDCDSSLVVVVGVGEDEDEDVGCLDSPSVAIRLAEWRRARSDAAFHWTVSVFGVYGCPTLCCPATTNGTDGIITA